MVQTFITDIKSQKKNTNKPRPLQKHFPEARISRRLPIAVAELDLPVSPDEVVAGEPEVHLQVDDEQQRHEHDGDAGAKDNALLELHLRAARIRCAWFGRRRASTVRRRRALALGRGGLVVVVGVATVAGGGGAPGALRPRGPGRGGGAAPP